MSLNVLIMEIVLLVTHVYYEVERLEVLHGSLGSFLYTEMLLKFQVFHNISLASVNKVVKKYFCMDLQVWLMLKRGLKFTT